MITYSPVFVSGLFPSEMAGPWYPECGPACIVWLFWLLLLVSLIWTITFSSQIIANLFLCQMWRKLGRCGLLLMVTLYQWGTVILPEGMGQCLSVGHCRGSGGKCCMVIHHPELNSLLHAFTKEASWCIVECCPHLILGSLYG